MRVPLSWLRQYVDIGLPAKEIADKLTFSGTEVEGIEQIGSAYENFVVAEVRATEKHPNADKLTICKVFDGVAELQVVCGAPNVTAGGKYPFARIGATLPDGSFTIKKAKIRGVESFGMLCAADELGQPGGHDGLFVLDPASVPGTPLAQVFGPPETVIELEITPNRPDSLSMIGVAREVAAVTGAKLKWPELATPAPQISGLPFQVSVEAPSGCPRYTARLLRNIKIGPSPDWMKQRLEHSGIRAINNVVDITNYVMLECGHPLHAFDFELLRGGKIVVRRATAGEKMATLDGVERELNPSMLLIADAERAVAVAGVMGGAGSEIRDVTTTVLLEAATFAPNDVRATARALGLSTESSYRFERGVDAATVDWASRRAAQLMCELAGATLEEGYIDVYPAPVAPRAIPVRFDYIRERLGVAAPDAEIFRVFQSLEFSVAESSNGWKNVTVPTFRNDLQNEVDFVEEFARVWGLEKIPAPQPRALVDAGDDRRSRAIADLRTQAVGLGLREIYNYSLVSEPLLNLFDGIPSRSADIPVRADETEHRNVLGTRIVLPRPISADQSILRPSLIPQMIETLGRNRAHQIEQAGLFEIGRAFSTAGESDRLCAGLMGPAGRGVLDQRRTVESAEMFGWIKGVWESLAAARKVGGWTLKPSALPCFEPGQGVDIVQGTAVIGSLGVIRANIRREWRLNEPVGVLEVAVDALTGLGAHAVYKALPGFPSTQRDVALVADEKIRHEDIVAAMRKAAPAELESIQLFDIFAGAAIGAGRKSMAYALTYRSTTKTLTDEEANAFHDRIKAALKTQLGVEIRES